MCGLRCEIVVFLKGEQHMNPLDTISGTIIAGVVLTIILAYLVKLIAGV